MNTYLLINNWQEHSKYIEMDLVHSCGWSIDGHKSIYNTYPVIFDLDSLERPKSSWMPVAKCDNYEYTEWVENSKPLDYLIKHHPELLI